MWHLPLPERVLFFGILISSIASAILGHVQLVREGIRIRHLLIAFVAFMISLAALLLVFRAVSIQAFPLTGIFESMIILLIGLGITFLFLSAFLQHIWFASAMAWVFLVLVLLAAVVARPAATLQEEARTPWIIVHAFSMITAGTMIVFSTVMAVLYLLCAHRLKYKQISALFGKMPNLEKLESLNLLGLQFSFVAMSFGLVTGIGLALVKSDSLHMTLQDWLTDSKIVMILLGWLLLLATLLLKYGLAFRGKAHGPADSDRLFRHPLCVHRQLVPLQVRPRFPSSLGPDRWGGIIPMQIILVGINHKTAAIDIREQLAFDPPTEALALQTLKTEYPSGEFVLLSTCNRVECYAAVPLSAGPDPEALARRLAQFRKVDYAAIRPYLYIKLQEDAVRHLFTVTSSLDSMVIGESQIVAQVKEGYKRACDCHSTGKILNHLFHVAFHVSKEIFSSTSIAARRVSIAGVAVELARQLFADIRNVRITVIGAGQMGELLIEHFRHLHCTDITVVNRGAQRACRLAEEHAIRSEPWDRLDDLLVETGIVVGAAAAQEGFLFGRETFKSVMARRRSRPLLVLDLAVPRSVDPAVHDLDNLYLYGIDDLGKVIEDNIQFREGDLEQAVEILCRHVAEFMNWYQLRGVGPLLGEIQEAFNRIRDAELQKFFSGLQCEASCRDPMEASVRGVVNKLLHCVVKNIVHLAEEQGPTEAERFARGILSRAEGVLKDQRDKENRTSG